MHPDREIDIADVCDKRSHQKQKKCSLENVKTLEFFLMASQKKFKKIQGNNRGLISIALPLVEPTNFQTPCVAVWWWWWCVVIF